MITTPPQRVIKIKQIYLYACICAAMTGLSLGYNIGVIAPALLFFQKDFALSHFELGVAVAAMLAGITAGSIFGGRLADTLGRRRILLVSSASGTLFVLACAFSWSVEPLIIFRLILGFLLGMASPVAPMYIAEVAPVEFRGGLVSLFQLFFAFGVVFSRIAGAALAHQAAWRWMIGFGALFPLIQFAGMLTVPDTPQWLTMKNRIDDARRSMALLKGRMDYEKRFSVLLEYHCSGGQKHAAWRALFQSPIRAILLLCLVVALAQQFTGVGAILSYAPMMFERAGINNATLSIILALAVSFANVAGTVFAILTVDKWGRRPLLLIGTAGLTICIFLIALCDALTKYWGFFAWPMFGATVCFRLFYSLSLGPITMLLISELFPETVRGRAMSLLMFIIWLGSLTVGFSFPWVAQYAGMPSVFVFFGLVGVVSWFFFFKFVPETKGRDIDAP